jgi:Rrf2 family nitric oxide-sensitive transcriptional repressor
MQLSLHADYACRTLIYLAIEPYGSIAKISEAYGISKNHLVKVVHQLGQAGYLKTTRGKNGGIQLAKSASEISIGDVVRRMEPGFDLVECFNRATNSCPILPGCGLNHALKEATEAFLSTLDEYSVADVIKNKAFLRKTLLAGSDSSSART